MAFDAYLKFDGIDGEVSKKGFEKHIELYSFSLGASNPTSIGVSGGGGAGRASLSSFNFMKKTDSASPLLYQACCSGKHFPKVKATLNKATGAKPLDYLTYEFEECFVSSIQWSGSSGGDDTPTESVSVDFASMKVTYTPQTGTGDPGSPVIGNYSLTQGVR